MLTPDHDTMMRLQARMRQSVGGVHWKETATTLCRLMAASAPDLDSETLGRELRAARPDAFSWAAGAWVEAVWREVEGRATRDAQRMGKSLCSAWRCGLIATREAPSGAAVCDQHATPKPPKEVKETPGVRRMKQMSFLDTEES